MQNRKIWVNFAVKLATPIYKNLPMPILVTGSPTASRIEAVARLTCGLAPWFELNSSDMLEEERYRRHEVYERAVFTLKNLFTNPGMTEQQNLIDAGYLCQAFFRSPRLWADIGLEARQSFLYWLQSVNLIKAYNNNWILQKALVNTFLFNHEPDATYASQYSGEVRRALVTFGAFYKGDGIYGDGDSYSANYYNSIVVHPAIMDCLRYVGYHTSAHLRSSYLFGNAAYAMYEERYLRYVEIQERSFSESGSFPIIGRSAVYRLGAFYALAYSVLHGDIVNTDVKPAAVRCALTAALRMMQHGMFNKDNFLVPGVCTADSRMADSYVSTGSLYATAFFLLPLGLSPSNEFWAGEDAAWTGRKVWRDHESVPVDWALEDRQFKTRAPWPNPSEN